MEENNTKKKIDKKKAGIIALIILILLAIVLGVTQPWKHDAGGQQNGMVWDTNAEEGGLVQKSDEEIQKELNEKVAQGMINISMNTAPYFENGTADGNVMIVNEAINNYPQQVEFIRNDTGEQIYQSKAIPVGSKIERAALDVELPAGTYECTAMFHNLDPETGDIIGTAGAIITITIKN